MTYQIQRNPTTSPLVVHVDHLKLYEGDQDPSEWIQNAESDESFVSAHTPQQVTYANDASEHDDVSNGSPDDQLTDDAYQSPQAELLRRSRSGRTIQRPIPYSPTL